MSSREGGPSLNILSGFVAGNFSAYWLGRASWTADGNRVHRQQTRARRDHCSRRRCSRSGSWRFGFLGWVPSPSRSTPTAR